MLLAEAQRVGDPPHDQPLGGLHHDPVLGLLDRPADLGMHLLQVRLAGPRRGTCGWPGNSQVSIWSCQPVQRLAQPRRRPGPRTDRPGSRLTNMSTPPWPVSTTAWSGWRRRRPGAGRPRACSQLARRVPSSAGGRSPGRCRTGDQRAGRSSDRARTAAARTGPDQPLSERTGRRGTQHRARPG